MGTTHVSVEIITPPHRLGRPGSVVSPTMLDALIKLLVGQAERTLAAEVAVAMSSIEAPREEDAPATVRSPRPIEPIDDDCESLRFDEPGDYDESTAHGPPVVETLQPLPPPGETMEQIPFEPDTMSPPTMLELGMPLDDESRSDLSAELAVGGSAGSGPDFDDVPEYTGGSLDREAPSPGGLVGHDASFASAELLPAEDRLLGPDAMPNDFSGARDESWEDDSIDAPDPGDSQELVPTNRLPQPIPLPPRDEDDAGASSGFDGSAARDNGSTFGDSAIRGKSLHERLRNLPLSEQQKIARAGELNERIALERMYGKHVWEALLRNPRLTPPEVARIARMRALPQPLLELVVSNPSWLASAQVRRALLTNTRLRPHMVASVLRATPKAELKLMPKQTAYPAGVREAAAKLLR